MFHAELENELLDSDEIFVSNVKFYDFSSYLLRSEIRVKFGYLSNISKIIYLLVREGVYGAYVDISNYHK